MCPMHNGAQFLFAFLVGDPTSRDRNRPLSAKFFGTSTSTSLWGRWAPTGLVPRPSPPTHMLGYYGRAPVAPGRARELCPPPPPIASAFGGRGLLLACCVGFLAHRGSNAWSCCGCAVSGEGRRGERGRVVSASTSTQEQGAFHPSSRPGPNLHPTA